MVRPSKMSDIRGGGDRVEARFTSPICYTPQEATSEERKVEKAVDFGL
jgi:hypothetical protein